MSDAKHGRLFVCGDMHGIPSDTRKINARNFPEGKHLSEQDVIIQLGDFGWIWYPFGVNKEQEHWLDWIAEKPFTFAFLPGNHENYDIIETLPTIQKWGSTVAVLRRKTGDIYILLKGNLYTINGKTILAIGGAKSIDKIYRIPYKSWWPQETLTKAEEDNTLDNLESVNNIVDYVLTHTCPTHLVLDMFENDTENAFYGMQKIHDPVSEFLEYLDNIIAFKEWHFGHMHKDQRIEKYNCVYQCHYNKPPHELD